MGRRPRGLHILPFRFQFRSQRRIGQRVRIRNRDSFKLAFFAECSKDKISIANGLTVPSEVNDIIKVTRPHSFPKRADFFGKQFLIAVTECLNPFLRTIAIGVVNFAPGWFEHHSLVVGQLQFDSGR